MKIKLEQCDGSTKNPGLEFRLVSTCKRVEMGVYPVIFGARIRAGFVGTGVCEIDWCMGNDSGVATAFYHILKGYIETFEQGENPFENLPGLSKVKPVWNDEDFMQQIKQELEGRTVQLELI